MEVQTVILAAIFYHLCLRLLPHINCTVNGNEVEGGGGLTEGRIKVISINLQNSTICSIASTNSLEDRDNWLFTPSHLCRSQ